MLETEAKKKWCPFTLGTDDRDFCRGQGCMAWQRIASSDDENMLEGIRRYRAETGEDVRVSKAYVEQHPEYLRKATVDAGVCARLVGRQ